MRRLIPFALLTTLFVPAAASAAGWHNLADSKAHFSLSYPGNWKARAFGAGAGSTLAVLTGPKNLAVTVTFVPIRPASSLAGTAKRFNAYQQSLIKKGKLVPFHWSTATLGSSPALVTVAAPARGSKMTISTVLYLAQYRGKVYEVLMSAYHKPALRQLSQFPSVYRRMMATWRFI